MFKNIKVETEHLTLDAKKFTEKELSLIDIKGLARTFTTIRFDKISPEVILALRDFIRNQYKLPIKYIECVDFKYSAKKRDTSDITKGTNTHDDYLYIEPLNNNYPAYIRYIPINQSLPLDTNIIININEEKMEDLKPNYYFLRSNSMRTDENIEDVIKKNNPKSIYTKPWLQNVHIGSLDIDSQLLYKGKVAYMNPIICNSLTLFGFKRDDNAKYFTVFTYDCYNITPKNIFELMSKQEDINKECKEFCETVLSKMK